MKNITILLVLLFLLGTCLLGNESFANDWAFEEIKRLPVQHEGRLKPLDTVARNALLIFQGKGSLYDGERKIPPIEWLLDMIMHREKAQHYRIFRIDHPDVLGLIRKSGNDGKYYSFQDLAPYIEDIRHQTSKATAVNEKFHGSYQQAVVALWQKIVLYTHLNHTLFLAQSEDVLQEMNVLENGLKLVRLGPQDGGSQHQTILNMFIERYTFLSDVAYFRTLYPLDNDEQHQWMTTGEGLLARINGLPWHPGLVAYATMSKAYRENDSDTFNNSLLQYQRLLKERYPDVLTKSYFEVIFNNIQPFFISIICYLLVFLLVVLSWILWPTYFYRMAFYLLVMAFFIHSGGLIARMYLEGRPPVTNLYSSAVFVGWAAVFLGLILERLHRNSFGMIVSAAIGGMTLVIAHHLSGKGDTMEMMRAVLNSNFWLSIHVVTITIGYSSAFLAGFLGCFFILRNLIRDGDDGIDTKTFGSMVYGIICFSTLFSFIGTVLGGIWADQSWGRFWGWDPKENGALLIVLWNAIILHAGWGGLVATRGLMILAVFCNIVTGFSWFGVNMLGVGLHSYGFTDQMFLWLFVFVLSQLLIIFLGCLLNPSESKENRVHKKN